jgi:hypothetical protein
MFPPSNHQLVAGVHESLSEAKSRVLDIMSQAGSLSQAMDIIADAAATGATTPAASAVGNQRKVSQNAAEKQPVEGPPPEFFGFGCRPSPGAEGNMVDIIKHLRSMEKRLTASNEVNYKKPNESLLEKIVELSQMIKSLKGRITFLEEE